MKRIMQFFKYYFSDFFNVIKECHVLLIGIGLFINKIFSFSSNTYCDESGLRDRLRDCYNPATYYYYDYQTTIWLTIAAILIVIGLFKIKNHNINKDKI